MIKEQPSLCLGIAALGRTLYVQTLYNHYSPQPDFDLEIAHCSCSVMRIGITYQYWYQMKEDELNSVTMKIIIML